MKISNLEMRIAELEKRLDNARLKKDAKIGKRISIGLRNSFKEIRRDSFINMRLSPSSTDTVLNGNTSSRRFSRNNSITSQLQKFRKPTLKVTTESSPVRVPTKDQLTYLHEIYKQG